MATKEQYDTWTKKFMEAWRELDYQKALETLDKSVEYYETPIGRPCSSFDDVMNLWKVIPDTQKDITYAYKILACDQEVCIVNWQMTRTLLPSGAKQQIDGIFQIRLNDAGKCTYFKQWRYIKS